MHDALFSFARQQALAAANGGVVGTNIHAAPAATKLFDGKGTGKLVFQVTKAGGANPTVKVEFISADETNANLGTNPVVLATHQTPVLTAANLPYVVEIPIEHQKVAKTHYGVKFTTGAADHTATVNAHIAEASQTRLVR